MARTATKPVSQIPPKTTAGCAEALHNYKDCPIFLAVSLIAKKWSVRILYVLLHAPGNTLRFGQLQKTIPGISQRELTKHLREFENAGLIRRHVFPEIPPRVEYELTALGQSLCEPIDGLSQWAEKYGPEVQRNRAHSARSKAA